MKFLAVLLLLLISAPACSAVRLRAEAEYTHPLTGERVKTVSNEVVVRIRGDVTGDGRISIIDALCIMRWVLAGRYPDLFVELADWNGDGKPNIADAVLCLRYSVGLPV